MTARSNIKGKRQRQRTVPGYAGVRGSVTNNATVTVNGNPAWRLGEYFYSGDDVDNSTSAVMKELDITAVVNPPGTNEADIVQSVTGRVFVAQSPEAFTYDDDGNMTSDGRFVYAWDGENRLVAVETRTDLPASVPRIKVTYAYDHRSRRIGKQSYTWATDHWTPVTDHSFTYDGWNLIQELTHTQTHTLTNLYTWGLDLSGSLQGAGGVGGLLAVSVAGVDDPGLFFSAYDGNGNVCEYTDASGSIAAHYEYSPFGKTVIQSGFLADSFAFRFSTKYWEDEAQLYYYGYRFYAPDAGRWLNRDPIGERGGVALYLSVNNTLLNGWDYNGKAPQWIWDGVTLTQDENGNLSLQTSPDWDYGDFDPYLGTPWRLGTSDEVSIADLLRGMFAGLAVRSWFLDNMDKYLCCENGKERTNERTNQRMKPIAGGDGEAV